MLARRAVADGVPVAAVGLRLTQTEGDNASTPPAKQPNDEAGTEPTAQMEAVADHVYRQIGFPTRRAWLWYAYRALTGISISSADLTAKVAARTELVRDRLCLAFRTLFWAADELQNERVLAGMSFADARPVVLLDEVQDLIRDDRLARVGGRYVFRELAVLLVRYCVDKETVRAAVAGSSALLLVDFDKTVARPSRWLLHELEDPEPGVVREALIARGYSAADAAALVAQCGPRLRRLKDPLERGAAAVAADAFLRKQHRGARADIRLLFARATPSERALLTATLDTALLFVDGAGPPGKLVAGLRGPTFSGFSERLVQAASAVLYFNFDLEFMFQTPMHAAAWRSLRAEMAKLK